MRTPVRGIFAAFLIGLAAVPAGAQEFRVFTRVYDVREARDPQRPRTPVGRSTALFHAGKVYDCVDSGNQMTIYEPAQERFVMIDGARRVMTLVPQRAIESLLHAAEKKGKQKLEELRSSSQRGDIQTASHIDFQLYPRFTSTFDAAKGLLRMEGRELTYTVRCAPTDPEEVVDAYLDYADWAARLNYIVSPPAPLPLARLSLNDTLREHRRIPVEVTLKVNRPGGLHRTAEHRFDWKIDASDREIIRHWEKLLSDQALKRVSLEDYLKGGATGSTGDRR